MWLIQPGWIKKLQKLVSSFQHDLHQHLLHCQSNRKACSSQIRYLSNSTKITANTGTAMLTRRLMVGLFPTLTFLDVLPSLSLAEPFVTHLLTQEFMVSKTPELSCLLAWQLYISSDNLTNTWSYTDAWQRCSALSLTLTLGNIDSASNNGFTLSKKPWLLHFDQSLNRILLWQGQNMFDGKMRERKNWKLHRFSDRTIHHCTDA